ncbi:MAG: hypothetical protein WEB62_02355 [Bacteroidota bacterium]
MRNSIFFPCLPFIFLYLLIAGCTESQDLITPTHFTRVPAVQNLQGAIGATPSGKRQILVTWTYDTQNSNIRSWDLARSIDDTAGAAYVPLEIISKPALGFPSYSDTSAIIQNDGFIFDSLDVYYKIIPNGNDNFIGKPSDPLHIVVRRQ